MSVQSNVSMLLRFVGREPDPSLPIAVRYWDGKLVGQNDAKVTIALKSPASLLQLLPPTAGKFARAYVEGAIDIIGNMRDVVALGARMANIGVTRHLPRLLGPFHTRRSDRNAIQFHYDVSNDFYSLWLDRNMVYSCAYFHSENDTLDQAQQQKLDHICRKLCLQPGDRFLDVGCGWGGLILWAAQHYGAHCVGITLSQNQHQFVSNRIRELGLQNVCEVRLADYRELDERQRFNKIASVGMFEHVGRKNLPLYFSKIYRLLEPGGLVLNHGISTAFMKGRELSSGFGDFIDRYVFPDGELVHVAEAMHELADSGLEARDVECLRPHYAKTLWHWVDRLDRKAEIARQYVGEKSYRVWRMYMAASAYAFERGWISLYQILGGRPRQDGSLPYPLTRAHLYDRHPGFMELPSQVAAREMTALAR
ncbi:MAG TPA: cyclopropane-fatty-acyl-phospholipid synthase family protein [Stenotrophobium sp.]|nr:cyclopropane-fatty-acyl-phospholipid synthase family protein [Stenotrophobium sp.]